MDNISTLYDALKPLIIGLIRDVLAAVGASGSGDGGLTTHDLSGSAHSGTLGIAYVPDALDRNGSRTLVGNLTVADTITVDGVDVSALGASHVALEAAYAAHDAATATAAHDTVGAHNHLNAANGGQLDHGTALAGLGDDDHTQYATVASGRSAYLAERLTKSVVAGDGLTGGGVMDDNRTINVGPGDGLTIGANNIEVDQTFPFYWYGAHTFDTEIFTSALRPRTASTFDVGLPEMKYRVGNFEEFRAFVFAELELHPVGGFIIVAKDQGNLSTLVLAGDTQIDFGKTMVPGDTVDLRTAGQYERMLIGALAAGTTYNVTRNLDGSGANDWNQGDVWVAFGQSANNNGWIQLNAYDSPRLQLYKKGTAWNNDKELIRLGDLVGNWGYASSTFGLAIGEYIASKSNITLDEDGVLRLRSFATDIVRLGTDGIFDLVGQMKISGSVTWNSLKGLLDAAGMRFTVSTVDWSSAIIQWKEGATTRASVVAGYDGVQWALQLNGPSGGGIEITPTDIVFSNTFFNFVNGTFAANGKMEIGGTAFPATPTSGHTFYRTDFRGWFQYDGSGWVQTSVGSGTAFPASPTDNLRFYRTDRDLEYFYNTVTSQWLTTEVFVAPLTEVRAFGPYTSAGFGVSDTVALVWSADTRLYALRVLDTHIAYVLGGVNSGTHYWHYRLNYDKTEGGGSVDLIGTAATPINTSALAASATGTTDSAAATIAANTKGGRFAMILRTTGAPAAAVFRAEIRYRMVG